MTIEQRLDRIEATLATLATKADVAAIRTDCKRWLLAATLAMVAAVPASLVVIALIAP